MTVVVCIFAFFSGNYDGILRGIIGGVGISLLMVWVTRGAFGYELGGCGSETDWQQNENFITDKINLEDTQMSC